MWKGCRRGVTQNFLQSSCWIFNFCYTDSVAFRVVAVRRKWPAGLHRNAAR